MAGLSGLKFGTIRDHDCVKTHSNAKLAGSEGVAIAYYIISQRYKIGCKSGLSMQKYSYAVYILNYFCLYYNKMHSLEDQKG